MRALIDTNIVLDWILERQPWFSEALPFWQRVELKLIVCYITATTITDIFYITRQVAGLDRARAAVRMCLDAFEMCTVDRTVLEEADALPGSDFEDNVQIACATIASVDAIVTRDRAGFRSSTIPVLTPAQAVERLAR